MLIYLDYNATTPLRPEAQEAMLEVMAAPANPSSVHTLGRKAKQRLEEAREVIARAVSAFPNEVIFTASGTEANNLALRSFAGHALLVSSIEHASVFRTAQRLGGDFLPVDEHGVLKLDVLKDRLTALAGKPALVSVMLANNETGVIQPIAEIAKLVKEHGGLLHCDAVQAIGKIPVDMGLLGVDMLTISAHKCGGPVGVGALIVRQGVEVKPQQTGGGQEQGRRAGTENIAAIVGFAKALELAANYHDMARVRPMIDKIEQEILAFASDAVIASHAVSRLPNTTQIIMPNIPSETQLMTFDLEGLAVSAGSACSSGRIEPSHVLRAMGMPDSLAGCAIRVSLGWGSKEADVMKFIEVWKKTYQRLAQQNEKRRAAG